MKTVPLVASLLIAAAVLHAQPYLITTVAGGALPQTPVTATDASVSPSGVTVDTAGNVFFSSRNAVFKLDAKGVLTHIAGNSRLGFSGDGGPALDAQFNYPNGLAFDKLGNLYIADTGNNRVRRISTDGLITTVAGLGTFRADSGDGGPATEATLYEPFGVALDSAGNLYVGDDRSIRKVSADGMITTLAECPVCGAATGAVLALDSTGNLYIASSARVWKITSGAAITEIAGLPCCLGSYSGEGGPATQAILGRIGGIAMSAKSELFLADTLNARVLRIAADGTIHTFAAGLLGPSGLAFDPAGNLYVAERGDPAETQEIVASNLTVYVSGWGRRLRKIAADGTITTAAGNGTEGYSGDGGPSTAAQLDAPWGLAADSRGSIYISDSGNHTVRKIASNGIITTVAGTAVRGSSGDGGPATHAQLNQPLGIAMDGAGNLFIAECLGARIREVSAAGVITTVAGTGASGYSGDGGAAVKAQLACPHGVAADASGNVYIADTGNQRLRKVGPDGTISTVAGNGSNGFAGDGGPALNAQLFAPTSLALDPAGNLYIADTGNNRIRRIDRNGTIDTVAGGGQSSLTSSNDGIPATTAVLGLPQGVAVDSAGNLYIGDTQGNHLRRVSPTGIISTIAGRALYGYLAYFDGNLDLYLRGYSGDGGPSGTAQTGMPYGLAVDPDFNVYLADLPNAAVRMLKPSSIASAASVLYGPIAAGEIVTLHGFGLGPGTLSTSDAGTQVFVNGVAAQVIYSSATQVAAIVPAITGSTANFEVRYLGKTALSFPVPLLPFAPSLFTSDATGRGLAAAMDQDGSYNSLTNSAVAGDTITLFATGDGLAAQPNAAVTVTIGGVGAQVLHIGPAPGRPGVTQIDVKVPMNALAATGFLLGQNVHVPVPVVLQVGGVSSQPGVYITVLYCCVLG
jgi:trimeric autotransporter adhesin